VDELTTVKDDMVRNRILTVPACRECNGLLNASYQDTLHERKQALKEGLRKRYRKELAMPDWSDEELEEFGSHLREYIEQSIKLKYLVIERLRW